MKNNEVFNTGCLMNQDVLFLDNDTVAIVIGHNLVDVAGKKIFIHEIEQKIRKVKRKKCTLAERKKAEDPLYKRSDYRKKSRAAFYNSKNV